MQNMVSKLLLIFVIVGLCSLALVLKPLRLGSDLRGGTSLIYSVRIDPDADAQQVLNQTIEVLMDRVNPTGVLDIFMQPLGLDRIEIVMPLPGDEIKKLVQIYRDALDQLLNLSEISAPELTLAIKEKTAVNRFCVDPESSRCQIITELQSAYEERQFAQEVYDQAIEDRITGRDLFLAEQAVADADITYQEWYDDALSLSLNRSRVERTLKLDTTKKKRTDASGQPVLDAATGKQEILPSPRDVSISSIMSEFPYLADQLDTTVAAFDEYQKNRRGFDDPEDLMRLLQGAGVLDFRIAVQPGSFDEGVNIDEMRNQLQDVGPENTDSTVARWFPINDLKQWYDKPEQLASLEANPISYFRATNKVADVFEGKYYLLLYTTATKSMTHDDDRSWSIINTYLTIDSLGRNAVSFQLDGTGGGMMSQLTGPHVGQPMAIVLDGEVFSAPRLQSSIGNSGVITGNFSSSELNYLIRVLAAGSLEARLSDAPIAINTLGPTLGADNLARAREAFILAIIAVALFMFAYYFFAGLVANLGLMINGVIIFGFMAAIDGTFTLPGLAGIVLTIGMAVDANVLIYERIREELVSGEWDLRGAIREGYRKAMSTIIDANVTNLIVCFVLFQTATTEVKGFAVTLSIGIFATLFTALFVTRQVYYLYTDLFGFEKLTMLPTAVPAIHRMLEPKIKWISMRKLFWTGSLAAVVVSIVLISSRGADMLDTEFRGGVSIMMQTALDPSGSNASTDGDNEPAQNEKRLLLPQSVGEQSIEQRLQRISENALDPEGSSGEERTRRLVLREFRNASVVTVGDTEIDPTTNAVVGSRFQIKIPSPKELGDEVNITNIVAAALVDEFGDELDVTPALSFEGAGNGDYARNTVRIEDPLLGQNVSGSADVTDVREFLGGVGVLLRGVDPPVTTDDIAQRIERMRQQPDFSDCIGRSVLVVGLGSPDRSSGERRFQSLVVVVWDEDINYRRMDPQLVDTQLAKREWELANAALTKPTSFEQVSSFSSAVAQTMKAKAIVSVVLTLLGILCYIWVRFGSLRYSVAAIIALIHDVIIALGILALTGLIGSSTFASMLLIEEFKIDLGVVAALLTVIGYSLNDTIVILDRIRENRGKLPLPSASIINTSINQTISRTVLTSLTTLLAVAIMYYEGGSGMRSFTFCLLVGLFVGTYSSVAIAAPLVLGRVQPDPSTETEVN